MGHRVVAHAPPPADPPELETRPDILSSFLDDAAHVPGGFAEGVAFPASIGETAALVATHPKILPIGAQSSLTGGATPRGGVLLGTRGLRRIEVDADGMVRVGAGVPLADLRRTLAQRGRYYPPVPTFDGAFIGGTIATNAAGAATFKYGSTRQWIEALTIVLADGSLIDVRRRDVTAAPDGSFELEAPSRRVTRIPVPSYTMPQVPKLSAGYFAQPGMDLIDLFVGSEGTLGIVVEALLRTVPLPRFCVALVVCDSERKAIEAAATMREEAIASWSGNGPLDVAAIEYVDADALACVPDESYARAGIVRPPSGHVILLVQIETAGDEFTALHRLGAILEQHGIGADPQVAAAGDERGAARLLELREAVPAAVNALVAAAKARVDPAIQKTAGDMIVPFEHAGDSLRLYREQFVRRGLKHAIWGHLSDGNLHANVIPESLDDVGKGREALLEIARGVMAMRGAPLAEHGVGRSPLKQRLLLELYGARGIDEMRAVKLALDPTWKLAPGVLFPEP
jgi:D-lactate dehydrogenase (cytochrome)